MATSRTERRAGRPARAVVLARLIVSAVAGVLGGVAGGLPARSIPVGVVLGWTIAATVFLVFTWVTVTPMDAAATASHATREDPTRGLTDVILLVASIASLAGVGLLVANPPSPVGRVPSAALAVGSVIASWFLVHTIYTLQYAAVYYGRPKGGIDFNQKEDPAYLDFAYMGFSLGMTYQVSDTSISSSPIRRIALAHSLLAYLLGAVVLAGTLNLVVGLAA